MAKLKTFAVDEILTAQDVNDYLNPDVPGGATVYDTGWVPITPASGFTAGPDAPAVRRHGMVLYFRGSITGSLTVNTSQTIGQLPAEIPLPGLTASTRAITNTGGFVGYGALLDTGGIRVHFKTPWATGSATVALSGFSGLILN